MTDEPRFLARSLGYVNSPIAGLHHEPEALTEADQADITERVHQTTEDTRREELESMLTVARGEVDHLAALTRHAEKQVRRLEQQFRRA